MGSVFIPKLEQYFQKKGLISLILLLVARYFNITWCIQNVQLFVQNNNSTCHCTPKTISIWSCYETKCIVHFTKKGWSPQDYFQLYQHYFQLSVNKQSRVKDIRLLGIGLGILITINILRRLIPSTKLGSSNTKFLVIKFDENSGIQAVIPALQSKLAIFPKSLSIIGQYSQFWHQVPYCTDCLIFAHTTLTVQSVLCRFLGC